MLSKNSKIIFNLVNLLLTINTMPNTNEPFVRLKWNCIGEWKHKEVSKELKTHLVLMIKRVYMSFRKFPFQPPPPFTSTYNKL